MRSAARRRAELGSDLADLIEAGLNEGAGEFAAVMGIIPRGALVGGGCDGPGPAGWPRVASMGSRYFGSSAVARMWSWPAARFRLALKVVPLTVASPRPALVWDRKRRRVNGGMS